MTNLSFEEFEGQETHAKRDRALDLPRQSGRLAEPRSFTPKVPGEGRAFGPPASPELSLDAGPFMRTAPRRLDADILPAPARAPTVDRRALIVMPCLNEAAFIGGLIEQVLRDSNLIDPLIVVSDGGSTDASRAIVEAIAQRDSRVRLLDNPQKFQSAGVNRAALLGGGRRWLVRMDVHMTYPDNYASQLIAEAERTSATSVVVSMESGGEGGFQKAAAMAQNSVLGTGGSAHRRKGVVGWVDHGHHALMQLDDFIKTGGCDEAFTHNEDAEFDHRLRSNGGQIWLTGALHPVYHPRDTVAALYWQYYNYGRGRARTVAKHHMTLKVRQALPLAVCPAVLLAMFAPPFWPAMLPAAAWAVLTLSFGLLLAIKARDLTVVQSGWAAMVMHFAWSTGYWREFLGHHVLKPLSALRHPASTARRRAEDRAGVWPAESETKVILVRKALYAGFEPDPPH